MIRAEIRKYARLPDILNLDNHAWTRVDRAFTLLPVRHVGVLYEKVHFWSITTWEAELGMGTTLAP
jgi:hypothetical protein